MSTNIYLAQRCTVCRRMDKPIHLGKFAAGWVFLIQGYGDKRPANVPMVVHSRADMEELCAMLLKTGYVIEDSYEKQFSLEEFMADVMWTLGTQNAPNRACEHSKVDEEGFSVTYEEFS